MLVEIHKLCTCFSGWRNKAIIPPYTRRIESTLRTLATWLTSSQVYPYYRAILITPLLKTRAVNIFNNISMTKVSMLWGQFINNSVTHNAYYYAQTLQFASVVCGAFASSLQSRVTYCQWLIKENRVFWMSWELVLRIRYFTRASSLGIGYFTRAVALGIGYLKLSAPERRLRVPDSLKVWSLTRWGVAWPKTSRFEACLWKMPCTHDVQYATYGASGVKTTRPLWQLDPCDNSTLVTTRPLWQLDPCDNVLDMHPFPAII